MMMTLQEQCHCKILVIGAGVAGLEEATAKRLGAIVSATDVSCI